ncbi:MAG: NADH-quinone oxidoreductase subunit [Chloroflexota bacterium]|jgi:NADH-quinone oxidoreductase subunit M|nr:NADH-quinone oxidoreductase subunit [Chloroflexota bacterium]
MSLLLILLAPGIAALATTRVQTRYLRELALMGTAVAFALSIVAALSALGGAPQSETSAWAPAAGLTFRLAADGVTASLLLLNSGISLLAIMATRTEGMRRPHLFMAMLLLAQVGAAGVLLAQDMVLFFIFWELVLVPFLVLIAVFGEGNRENAALKMLIYTSLGSLSMLVSIATLFVLSGSHSFLIDDLAHANLGGGPAFLGLSAAQLAFAGFAFAFAIKTPLFPFHGWVADAYTSCPTPALMVLAGVVSKLGPYGFYRVAIRLLPGAAHDFSWVLMTLAAVGIVYGALLALRQRDTKRTVIYLSVSHMCFITLGIVSLTSAGLAGGALQMVNHGLLITAMFFIVGHLETRLGTRDRGRLAGLSSAAPVLTGVFMLIALAVLGLPGLNGFAGEYLIMAGAYARSWPILLLAASGVILASWYTLRLYQGIMNGSPGAGSEEDEAAVVVPARAELASADLGILVPLVVAAIAIGVFPGPLVNLVNQGVVHLSRVLAGGAG